MSKSKKPLVLILLLAAAGAGVGYYVDTTRAPRDPNLLRIWGNIEVISAELSFKIPGRVIRRPVDEGQMVRLGQLVAVLDSNDLADQVAVRDGELGAAKAALAELLAGSRPEEIADAAAGVAKAQAALDELLAGSRKEDIEAAEATARSAKVDSEFQSSDLKRVMTMYDSGQATTFERDRSMSQDQMAKARLVQAEAQLRLLKAGPREEDIRQGRHVLEQMQQRHALAVAGPRKETIDQARARVRQIEGALALAKTQLSYATLTSPMTGMVMSKNIEPGEYVAPGTAVVTVGDLVNVWVRGYIDEADLGRVKYGQAATITTDTYPGRKYQGRVSFIASEAEFTPKNVQTEKQRVSLVYRIKVDIHNPAMELKAGMPVTAEIELGGEKKTAAAETQSTQR
jgi:HlyD family secretion protein